MQSLPLAQAATDLVMVAAYLTPAAALLIGVTAIAENTRIGRRFTAWAVANITKFGA